MNLFEALLNRPVIGGAEAPKPPVVLSTVNVLPAEVPKVPSSNVNMSFVKLPETVNVPPPEFFWSLEERFWVGEVLSVHAMIAIIARDRGKRGFIRSLRDRQILSRHSCRRRTLSAARLSRHPRSFGFADRSRNRGAFIGGGLWT